jgi:hypothetical protein
MGYGKFHNLVYGKLSSLSATKVNIEYLMSLWNGVVICDEVHNVYNSL